MISLWISHYSNGLTMTSNTGRVTRVHVRTHRYLRTVCQWCTHGRISACGRIANLMHMRLK